MKVVTALVCMFAYLASSSHLDVGQPGHNSCIVPEDYCWWVESGKGPQFRCLVPPGWTCCENVTTTVTVTVTYPPMLTHTLFPSFPSGERSRAEPQIKTLAPIPHYSERFSNPIEPAPSSTSEIKFRSHQITNCYNPGWQNTTHIYTSLNKMKYSSEAVPASTTSLQASKSALYPLNNHFRSTTTMDSASSTSLRRPPVTISLLAPSDAAGHHHDIIPFTTTAYPDDEIVRPSLPGPHDIPKPVLEVTCVDRSRLFWNDFKITWSAAWNDQRGCRRLFRAMNRRGIVTGWRCKEAANGNAKYIMQAMGHRPKSPRSLVADAIREAFEDTNTLYYRGYETNLLCEEVRGR